MNTDVFKIVQEIKDQLVRIGDLLEKLISVKK